MQRPAIRYAFRRLSLMQKFSMAIILLIFLVGLVFSTLIISRQRSSLHAEMEYSHLTMVRTLAKDAVEALVLLDPLRLDELVRTISLTRELPLLASLIRSQGSLRIPIGDSSAVPARSSEQKSMSSRCLRRGPGRLSFR